MLKKILISMLAIAILLAIAVRFGTPYYANLKLKKILSEVDSASYSLLDINVWAGDALIKDLYLADSSGNLAKQPVFAELSKAQVIGLDVWELIWHKQINMARLELGEGKIALSVPQKDTSSTTKNRQKSIKAISINKVRIDEIDIQVNLDSLNKNERYEGKLKLNASRLSIPLDTASPFNYDVLKLHLSEIYAQAKGNIAYFNIDSLTFDSDAEFLTVNGIKMDQRLPREKYASYFGFDKDFVMLNIYRVQAFGLPKDIQALTEGFHLSFISVLGPQVSIYKDRRLPHKMHARPFPIEAFNKLPIPIFIDSLAIIDGQLLFDENWRDDFIPGQLYLSDMQVKVLNLSNRGSTSLGDWTTLKGEIDLYQQLNLGIDWRFDLREKRNAFTLDLDIGSSPLSVLNPFTENTVGMQFKSGDLQGGRLHVEANKTSGIGTLDFHYTDMKLRFLNRENHNQNIWEWAGGGLLNLGIRNNNKADKKPRQGIVYAEPKPERAIFGYVTRMFFAGFKDIAVGSSNKKKAAERGFQYLDDIDLED